MKKTNRVTRSVGEASRAPAKAAARRVPRTSALLAGVHETVLALHADGHVDKATMREFDALCLRPIDDFAPEEIVRVRLAAAVSQPVFARYLNVGKSTVSQWERGEKKPDGPARKLLDLVRRKGLQILA